MTDQATILQPMRPTKIEVDWVDTDYEVAVDVTLPSAARFSTFAHRESLDHRKQAGRYPTIHRFLLADRWRISSASRKRF